MAFADMYKIVPRDSRRTFVLLAGTLLLCS
jgi:hypothetical protein